MNSPVTAICTTWTHEGTTLYHCPASHSWLNCFGHHNILLCISSKQKLTRFPKVDYCACSCSLCMPKVPIYTTSTKAINADEWLAMASLFRSSQRRKFPLSLQHLHSITLTGPGISTLHCFHFGTVFCVSLCF